MSDAREARIRERAYRIWESEGRPDDRHQVHWAIAMRIIDEEDAAPTVEDAVDQAGEDSFPASDPSSISTPTRSIESDPQALTDEPVSAAPQSSQPAPSRRRA